MFRPGFFLVGGDSKTPLFWAVIPAIRSRFEVGADSRKRLGRDSQNTALVVGPCVPAIYTTHIAYLAKWQRHIVCMRLWDAAHLRDGVWTDFVHANWGNVKL